MFLFIKRYFTHDLNVIVLFKPTYILLSCLGLFPYAVRFPTEKHAFKVTRKSFILHSFCGLIMFAFLCCNCYVKLSIMIPLTISGKQVNLITNINNLIGISCRFIGDVTVYFYTFRNAKVYVNILQETAFCWSELSFVNIESIMRYLRRRLVVPVMAWAWLFLTVRTVQCTVAYKTICLGLFLSLPEMVTSLVVIFYCAMMLLVVGLLKNIEMHCQMLVNTKHCSISRSGETTTTVNSADEENRSLLRHLELSYVKALKIKQKTGGAFETPLAFIILLSCHTALRHTHTMYHGLVISKTMNYNMLFERSFWIVYSLTKMYVLAYTGAQLQNEVDNIGQALHDIPTEAQERLCLEVQHFNSLMTFYRPETTIYDYFEVDTTLFFSILATLLTYVIMLVQFDTPPQTPASNFTFIGFRECCL